MLIPILTTKGKTKLSLKKYNLDNEQILGTYSNNGWINNGIIKIALEEIYKNTEGLPSALLLDQFTIHTSEFIAEEAKKRNIELIFVPKGLTSKYQPLDILINGILKQKAKGDITSEIIKKSFNTSCFL